MTRAEVLRDLRAYIAAQPRTARQTRHVAPRRDGSAYVGTETPATTIAPQNAETETSA